MYVRVLEDDVIYPYSLYQLRDDYPNTSFPTDLPNGVLADFGVFSVVSTEQPTVDYTKNLIDSVAQVGDTWNQVWVTQEASDQEKQERTDFQANSVREQRNELLAESDWTQLADAPVDKNAWSVYRQQLRDLTEQVGFPWKITFPNKPN